MRQTRASAPHRTPSQLVSSLLERGWRSEHSRGVRGRKEQCDCLSLEGRGQRNDPARNKRGRGSTGARANDAADRGGGRLQGTGASEKYRRPRGPSVRGTVGRQPAASPCEFPTLAHRRPRVPPSSSRDPSPSRLVPSPRPRPMGDARPTQLRLVKDGRSPAGRRAAGNVALVGERARPGVGGREEGGSGRVGAANGSREWHCLKCPGTVRGVAG